VQPHSLHTQFDAEVWICPIQYGIVCKGGGKGGSAQPPPQINPEQLAQAQTQSNVATALNQSQLNNINTTSPLGTTMFTYDPTTNRWSLNQNLNAQTQPIYNAQTSAIPGFIGQGQTLGGVGTGAALQAGQAIGSFNPNALPTSNQFPALTQQAQNAAYGAQTQYLDPQFSEAQSDLVQRLADQGISPNSPAYSRAMGDFNRQKQMAYQSAQDQAVAAGNAQEQALFQQGLQAYEAPVTAATGLGGIGGSLLGAGGATLGLPSTTAWAGQLPTFGGSPTTVTPTNVVGAAQVAANNAANAFAAQNTLNNQLFNGLGSLGSALGLTGSNGSLTSGLFSGLGSLFGGGAAADFGSSFLPSGLGALAGGLGVLGL
jgi:hypothetical protein